MSFKNRIFLASLGALAVSLTTQFAGPLPEFLVWLLGTGGGTLFLTALVLPTDLRNPPVHSLTILDKGYLTAEEVHDVLGIIPPSGLHLLEARDAQWTVARHVAKWRADRVVDVLHRRGVDSVRERDMLSLLQWVGAQLFPAFFGLLLLVPLLAAIRFGDVGSNFLQAVILFAAWAAVALGTRALLERYVIHRAVWEPELTSKGTFVEK